MNDRTQVHLLSFPFSSISSTTLSFFLWCNCGVITRHRYCDFNVPNCLFSSLFPLSSSHAPLSQICLPPLSLTPPPNQFFPLSSSSSLSHNLFFFAFVLCFFLTLACFIPLTQCNTPHHLHLQCVSKWVI